MLCRSTYELGTQMKTLILLFSVITLVSQSIGTFQNPYMAGNTAKLIWDANDTNESILHYRVYVSTNQLKTATVLTNVPLNILLSSNGLYQLNVTAVNQGGLESDFSGIWVRYWANKPTPPKGLTVR